MEDEIVQIFTGEMVYEHDNYIQDLQEKERMKENLYNSIKSLNIPFIKKIIALILANKLKKLEFVLEENEQRNLVLNMEIWKSDCLEYNVNHMYELLQKNRAKKQSIEVEVVCKFCNVENQANIKSIKMNYALRKSKENNPVIVLINDMFTKPFIINGNHRVIDASNKKEKTIDGYVINSDAVIECLISDDYKKAYHIFKQLYRLIGSKITC